MFGSYIIPIFIISGYFVQSITWGVFCPKLNFVVSQDGFLYCSNEITTRISLLGIWLNPILWFLIVIILGFLFGWGIHSLIKFLRKKK